MLAPLPDLASIDVISTPEWAEMEQRPSLEPL